MMKASDLRAKSKAELVKELQGLLKEHFNMRVQKATGQMTRTHLIKEVKRNIARVKTLIVEKELD